MTKETSQIYFILLCCMLFINILGLAQVPNKMSYQSLVRNSSGMPVANSNVGVRISILQGSATGSVSYAETHTVVSDANGIISLEIGAGTAITSTFSSINWATGPYFIKSETDPLGGSNYSIAGVSQLLSVPYALYAASGTPGPQGPAGLLLPGSVAGNTPYWSGANWVVNSSNIFNNGANVGIGTSTPSTKLDIAGTLRIVDGTQGAGKVLTSDASGTASWVSPSNGGWSLTGNAGTTATANFIGTIDNTPLKFRANNIETASFNPNTLSVYLGFYAGAVDADVPSSANIGIGSYALNDNTTGRENTAIGLFALGENITGNRNISIGNYSLSRSASGIGNVATGFESLTMNKTGNYNSAFGYQALSDGQDKNNNCAFGAFSMNVSNGGSNNVAIGYGALQVNAGSNNTAIGYSSGISSPTAITNSTAIGNGARVDASNKIRLGDTNISIIEGQVGFTSASDRRFKTNMQPITEGLAFIKKLRPMSFQLKNDASKKLNWGFIAQDIEDLLGTKNAVLTVGGDSLRLLGLRYSDFVAPLVKAIQEQQQLIDELQNKVKDRDKKIEVLEASFKTLTQQMSALDKLNSDIDRIKKSLGLDTTAKLEK